MNATQGLIKAYRVDNAGGVTQYAAVVASTVPTNGNCKLPAAANAVGFLGFTVEAQPNQYKACAVQKTGIARAVAGGTIAYGDRVVINGTLGDVKSAEAAIVAGAGTYGAQNVVGRAEESAVAGQIFAVWICPETIIQPVS